MPAGSPCLQPSMALHWKNDAALYGYEQVAVFVLFKLSELKSLAVGVGINPGAMAGDGNDIFQMPTLGRPVRIGMLYDRRTDTFIPGVTLWDLNALKTNLDVQLKPSTEYNIISSDEGSCLDVDASLKASFLGGLVEVSGSAKYLTNKKTSRQQSRLTLHYRVTSHFEELTMSQLGAQHITYPSVFEQGSATHVITGVLYGAQAFFVFDLHHSSTGNVRDCSGNLQVMIQKIPMFQIEGRGSLDMSDEDKKRVENFRCTFHGDIFLDRNPVTYQEAVEVYSTLPKLLGDRRENAVPLRVWLHPLKMLDPKAAQLAREVSIGLVNQCQALMDRFHDIEMRCNDLIESPAAQAFCEIKDKVQTFRRMVLEFQAVFQKGLAQALLSIRRKAQDDSILLGMLEGVGRSPFRYCWLDSWLEKREKEGATVDGYLAMLEGVDVLSKSQLNRVLVDPMTEHIVCFAFTSLGAEDHYLQELSQCLQTKWNATEPNGASADDAGPSGEGWFDVASVLTQMRKWACLFLQIMESNKCSCGTKGKESSKVSIASVKDETYPGASLYLYSQGILVNNQLTLQKADRPSISCVTDSSVTLHLKKPPDNLGPVLSFKVSYGPVAIHDWAWVDTEGDTETLTVTGLQPYKEYTFRFLPVYRPCAGLLSESTAGIVTLPASPPTQVTVSSAQATCVTIGWTHPTLVGAGVNTCRYVVEYLESQDLEDEWREQRTEGLTCTCTLANLSSATTYRVRVSADCGPAGLGTPSHEVVAVTTEERGLAELTECLEG
ncbi:hypothetical protein chiPu_0011707 [Chiloscyllium punctatum]|uniref:Fibronectin type-III domain-containing protein n=1 Tax=Chiloscyllium punctatum TaxID=137246 RepID=A0A401SS59_CHIPU|nr:hypothetical protein [Chiloscyllium punctatum]